MERRALGGSCNIETRADGSRVLVGYAAVFYRDGDPGTEYALWRGAVERVAPTAFDRALSRPDDVRGTVNHSPQHILGRTASGTMRLSKDARGLRYEIDIPDTQAGRDIDESVSRGDVTGSSFSFAVDGELWQRDDENNREIRILTDVRLYDVGPVTFPAYEGTSAGVRAEGDAKDAEVSHQKWRADASRKERAVQVAMRLVELDADGTGA